ALADVKPVGEWLGDDPELVSFKQPKWVVPVGQHKGAPIKDGVW
ncbi:MAG: hypothetical protein JWN31_1368, partial [Frankiales bacterium]|nr:hypothetical protein [Frankiales bacterium]